MTGKAIDLEYIRDISSIRYRIENYKRLRLNIKSMIEL